MTLTHALYAFFSDLKFQTALVVIFVDFALGVAAAIKHGNFRLSYVADFGRNDVLFKLLPWGALYVASKFAGHQQLVIPGIDLGVAAGAVYITMLAAWTGSIFTSLAELGFPQAQRAKKALQARYGNFPSWVAAPENASPPKN